MLAFSIAPASSPCESAEKPLSSAFWMMIDRPKVTTMGRVSSVPRVKLSSPRCST